VAAAVHHGGVGTTAAALRAGIPSIIVPFFADQFYWGRRVKELDAGPAPLPEKSITAEGLENAIRETVSTTSMVESCRAIAEKIRGENGVEKAADAVDRYIRGMKRGMRR
jgi:sterol 3beta-glucosyltransferase